MADGSVPGVMIRRMALVIGNGAYTDVSALKNPANDAKAMGKKLVDLGFEVHTEIDATSDRMIRAIGEFTRVLADATEKGDQTAAVFFYAGHGVQVDGENYLLPIDGEVRTKLDLSHRTIGLALVMEALSSAARNSVVLLDCCRDNPLPRTLGEASRSLKSEQGLAQVHAPKGVYVAFSTQPHFVALDGTGANSPFTEGLLEFIDDPAKNVSDVLMDVRRVVYAKTNGQQIPWDHSALFEPFRFVAGDVSKLEGLSPEARDRVLAEEAQAREESYWQLIPQTKDVDFIHSFVTQFPNSRHRAGALARIDQLKAASQWYRALRLIGAGALALLAAYIAVLYFLTRSLPDTNIAMGDIVAEDGDPGFVDSYLGCRLRCVMNRFDKPCIAFSYDRTPIDKTAKEARRRCFPKFEAVFSWKPSETGDWATDSEIMPFLFRSAPLPKESRFRLNWYRGLAGEPVDVGDVLPVLRSNELNAASSDPTTGRTFWNLEGAACQQACTDLGGKCRGFSLYAGGPKCELFKTVRGIQREATTGRPVYMPATISGCDDPNAPVDRETKQSECPARGDALSPRRGPDAATVPVPAAAPAAKATEPVPAAKK